MTSFDKFSNAIVAKYQSKGLHKSRNLEYAILKFKRFVNKDIFIEEVDYTLILEYEHYLIDIKKQSRATVNSDFKLLKIIFKAAVQSNIINEIKNPFYKHILKTSYSNREFLTEYEIDKIANLIFPENRIIDKIRDLFLFSCYCGGIRISDLLKLKKCQYDNNYINYIAHKNNYQHRIKVPKKAKQLIQKYQNTKCQNELLFPMFKNYINFDDEKITIKKLSSKINQINKELKIIAHQAGIKKRLSFHCSRHTFATNAISKGIPVKDISKILGHSNVQLTLNYAKIEPHILDNAMDKFNG
jgi:integrase